MLQRYRKKPTVIEAIQYDGRNWHDVVAVFNNSQIKVTDDRREIQIITLEGTMTASKGDYIVRGIKGELYPVKPDIFEKLHDKCPTLSEMAIEAAASYRKLPPAKRKEMDMAQRKSWVVGEIMLRNPHISKTEAEAMFEKVVF